MKGNQKMMRARLAQHSTENVQITRILALSARIQEETGRYATASLSDEFDIADEIAVIGGQLRGAMEALLGQPIQQMSEINPRIEAVLRYVAAMPPEDDRALIRTLEVIRDFLGGGDA